MGKQSVYPRTMEALIQLLDDVELNGNKDQVKRVLEM